MSAAATEEIRRTLERIAASNAGRITPEAVIEAARDAASPLHDRFTWDDKEAGHKQRMHEARELIRSVRVTTVVGETVHRTIAYVRNPELPSDEAGYISTAMLRTDADLARAVLVEEFARASAAMKRALEVAQALELRGEVQAFIDGVQSLKQRVESRV
jgi:hypothetical protein